ncbi:MAG: biosynthetic-type acetolactate synthase large subunit [Candidatus Bathyarchaeia archaeon]|nr:biosynthetic-type acetolactate synthase large subunit [Candidatus Bathyarchaeota archaeon]
MRMSGAKALVESLEKERVEVIFGLPGGAIMPVYDVLLDSKVRHILVRHEQSAAHMADGYARASRKTGVCMATSGPGATNLITGIATAHLDSSPIVAITGQVSTSQIGLDAFQEADMIGIASPVTKYSFQPRRVEDIPVTVKKAFHIASTGRPGPVLIDLPKDIQMDSAEVEFPMKVEVRGYRTDYKPDPEKIGLAAEILANSERPLILAGGGVILSDASEELQKVAETILAPVATSLMGKGSIPEDHPLSIGIIGMHGSKEANRLIYEADTLLAVGCRFSDRTTGKLDEFCPASKVIHIDIDPAEIGKNRCVDLAIISDAKMALEALYRALTKTLTEKKDTAWSRKLKEMKETNNVKTENSGRDLTPPKILKELRRVLPPEAIVTTEVGQNQMWASLYFKVLKPRTFITSGGFGCMGYGFPASIGAKTAIPNVPVVDVAGDGSFMMTENSLATSVTENIPVTVIILNNRMLGMVAQWQRLFYNRRYSAVSLGDVPDFQKLAEAYGAEGLRIGSVEEFSRAVKESLKSEVTTVIDVPIDPEENVLPMVPAGYSLKDVIG